MKCGILLGQCFDLGLMCFLLPRQYSVHLLPECSHHSSRLRGIHVEGVVVLTLMARYAFHDSASFLEVSDAAAYSVFSTTVDLTLLNVSISSIRFDFLLSPGFLLQQMLAS